MMDAYREAVEETHDCTATFRETVRVVDTFQGKTAWEGDVHVFDLEGNELATEAYAWKVKAGIVAVLKTPPVDGPLTAVRAAIVSHGLDRMTTDKSRRGVVFWLVCLVCVCLALAMIWLMLLSALATAWIG